MIWKVRQSTLEGTLRVPPSKSHTIRAFLVATLAEGTSVLSNALVEGDGKSALETAQNLGARCQLDGTRLTITGVGGDMSRGNEFINCGNSGTSTRLFASAVALGTRKRLFDGDDSLRTRKMKSLLDALATLGATYSLDMPGHEIPFTLQGPIRSGATRVSGVTSQFLSSLLFTLPLLSGSSTISLEFLNEKPYVTLTLWWLDKMGVQYTAREDYLHFTLAGGHRYHPITLSIPGDFSSATFGAVGAALTGGTITLTDIDFTDPQGDKAIFDYLSQMGASVVRDRHQVTVSARGPLTGIDIDCNATPDALPALSVLGCMAQGTTRLYNVKQARIKETDRIAVMAKELTRMGARIEEREDGLIIHQSTLSGCCVSGHNDHRVVMSLALAGMIASGETTIDTAEAAAVTYPTFAADFSSCGAAIDTTNPQEH